MLNKKALLDNYERLPDDDACKRAGAIVNLVSDVNDEIFFRLSVEVVR